MTAATPTAGRAFVFTDDPDDPCAYCVQWVEPDGVDPMESVLDDSARPVLADGSTASRVYRHVHRGCDAAVAAYVDQSSRREQT